MQIMSDVVFHLEPDFFEKNFERLACVIRGPNSSLSSALITEEEFDYLAESIGSNGHHHTHIYGGESPSYQELYPKNEAEAGGVFFKLNPIKMAFSNEGATVVLGQLQKFHFGVASALKKIVNFYRTEGKVSIRNAKVTAYHTPSMGHSFPLHHDNHDVFILQTTGEKYWRIYEPVIGFPVGSQKLNGVITDAPYLETRLLPGDLLYIPRGHPHVGRTIENQSLHMTFGIYTFTWLDFLQVMFADVEAARESLPRGFLESIQQPCHKLQDVQGSNQIQRILAEIDPQSSITVSSPAFVRKVIETWSVIPQTTLKLQKDHSVSIVDASVIFHRVFSVPAVVREFPDYIVLVSPSVKQKLPKELLDICRCLLVMEKFRLCEICSPSDIYSLKNVLDLLVDDGVYELYYAEVNEVGESNES